MLDIHYYRIDGAIDSFPKNKQLSLVILKVTDCGSMVCDAKGV